MFSFLGTCVKYSFYTSAAIAIGAGFFLNKTLPTDDSFYKFRASTEPSFGSTIDKIGMNVTGIITIDNYVIFKLATIMIGNSKVYYGGAMHNWVKIK